MLYMCQVLVRIVSQSSQWTHHLLAPGHRCLIKVTRIIILQVSPPSLVGRIIIAFYQHLPRVRESQVQQPDRPVSAKTRRAPVTGPGTRRSDGTHWLSGVCENILVTRNSVLSGCPGKCYQSSSLTVSSDSSFS